MMRATDRVIGNRPATSRWHDGSHDFSVRRMILVRNIWSDITPSSCRFEQAFSQGGGKTWEVNWIATDTRSSP